MGRYRTHCRDRKRSASLTTILLAIKVMTEAEVEEPFEVGTPVDAEGDAEEEA